MHSILVRDWNIQRNLLTGRSSLTEKRVRRDKYLNWRCKGTFRKIQWLERDEDAV